MDKNFEDFFAIIIGINDYGNTQLNTLDLARKDATDLHEFLIKTGGYKKANTVLLVDEKATKANINYHLEQLKVKFTARSTLVFYFSGHGSNAGNNYLLPLYNYDIEDRQSYYELQELIALFSEINVDKLLFMFDTCYSGILTKAKDVLEENPDQKESQELLLEKLVETDIHNSRVLIASSLPDQTSYEIRNANIVNGVFTHCLLNGLKGACQIEKNNQINIFELLRYLVKTVPLVASQCNIKQHCCVKTSVLYQDFTVCYSSGEVDCLTQLPKRYINAVIDLHEDRNTLLSQFANGLQARTIDSKFTYWGEEVTKQYIELLNTTQYSMPKTTSDLLSSNITSIIQTVKKDAKGIRVISLGIGDGYKDAIILKKICEITNMTIDYWIFEFSYEMLKTGLQNVRSKLGDAHYRRIEPKLFQTDFLDINIISELLTEDKVNLFLLLGNTLGNFPEDTLLNKIYSVMNINDFFLIDNQIKGENKLTKKERESFLKMYSTEKYKEYIFAILKNAGIKPEDGRIETQVTDYEPKIEVLRQYKCATVTQEFTFNKGKEVMLGTSKVSFLAGTILAVIYSRKYTKNALNALLGDYFVIEESYYEQNKYALILCKKRGLVDS